ncbi:MAG: FISUMP domain-containing protein [bacterium]
MNYRILAISIIALALIFISCDDKPTDPVELKITSITPNSGFIGDTVTISGNSFGTNQDTSYVLFPLAKGSGIKNWSNTKIVLKVPVGAKSGKVSVTVNGVKSNEVDFIVKVRVPDNKVIDVDGNLYNIKSICDRIWMTENLNVGHYRNGDLIPEVKDPTEWASLSTGAWCYYNNDPEMGAIYGKLYNWYAVNDPRGLAPDGWHIPTNEEWTELMDSLGGELLAGGKLKRTGTIEVGDGLWFSPNEGATNETGFSALPGGFRRYDNYDGKFYAIGGFGYWWSSTEYEYDAIDAWARELFSSYSKFSRYFYNKGNGYSVRCIKD